ncbi:hypothetical protein U9M48_012377 [Paspalum notatum var. saurae]|uniref:Uncharacterized protein n=1 Tax=Paspalum notatum var. saurae TaxID=547442 RepID=A0AAQ3SY58_PASNO
MVVLLTALRHCPARPSPLPLVSLLLLLDGHMAVVLHSGSGPYKTVNEVAVTVKWTKGLSKSELQEMIKVRVQALSSMAASLHPGQRVEEPRRMKYFQNGEEDDEAEEMA